MTDRETELENEVEELRSEIARHHRDFKWISEVCEDYFDLWHHWSAPSLEEQAARSYEILSQIRNVVG